MAAVYLATAWLFNKIPFIGPLLMVLLTPPMLVGALRFARALEEAPGPLAPVMAQAEGQKRAAFLLLRLRADLKLGFDRLISGFREEASLVPILVISTLSLGGVVIIQIIGHLLKANTKALAALVAGSIAPSVAIPTIVGLLVIIVLKVVLVLAVMYTVPLIVFRRSEPVPAIESSFGASLNNLGAVGLFAGAFVVADLIIGALYLGLPFPLDYLVILPLGLVLLPVFTAGLYRSHRQLFG
jgi:hypothetical protein